jgi:uncharacterized membrane protein
LTLSERYQVIAACGAMWFLTGQGMFFLIILGALYRVFWLKDHHPTGSLAGKQFLLLLAVLGTLAGFAETQNLRR